MSAASHKGIHDCQGPVLSVHVHSATSLGVDNARIMIAEPGTDQQKHCPFCLVLTPQKSLKT